MQCQISGKGCRSEGPLSIVVSTLVITFHTIIIGKRRLLHVLTVTRGDGRQSTGRKSGHEGKKTENRNKEAKKKKLERRKSKKI